MKGRELIELIEEEGLEDADIEIEFKEITGCDGWGNMGSTKSHVINFLKYSDVKYSKRTGRQALILQGNK